LPAIRDYRGSELGLHPLASGQDLLDGLNALLSTQVFGPYRYQLLDANVKTIDQNAQREHQNKIITLRHSIADTDTSVISQAGPSV